MTDLIALAQGIGHGLLLGIFSVAGVGKLAGCRLGSAVMCRKAALDLGIAAASAALWWHSVVCVAAMAAAGVAAVGLLREVVRKNPACNCFGILTGAFDNWRNQSRWAMIASGITLLATGPASPNSVTLLLGIAAGLATVLLVASHAFSNVTLPSATEKGQVFTAPAQAPDRKFKSSRLVARFADGQPAMLGDLVMTGRPLVLLFGAPNCGQCENLKKEIDQIAPHLPFPLYLVLESDAGPGLHGAHVLFDPDGKFRRDVPIIGVPSLIVIAPNDLSLAYPVSFGAEAVRRDLLKLSLLPDSRWQILSQRQAA